MIDDTIFIISELAQEIFEGWGSEWITSIDDFVLFLGPHLINIAGLGTGGNMM